MIIWLASYPKSGNTWLRAFLGCWLANEQVHVNNMPDWGLGGGDTRRDLYEEAAGTKLISADAIPKLRVKMQRNVAMRPGITFMKTHNSMGTIGGYPTIDPHSTAGAIYVMRDPRDVAVSYADHYGLTINEAIDFMSNNQTQITNPGDDIAQYLASWSYHVESWIDCPGLSCHVLKFEDMKANSTRQFKKMLRFLQQPVTQARIKRAVRNSSFRELQRQEAEGGFQEASQKAKKFFREGKTGGWREKLTKAQINAIEKRHGAVMERFGYLP